MKRKEEERVWRIWVDTGRRLVSFHEAPGCRLMEFRSQELFQRCVDEYTREHYLYQ